MVVLAALLTVAVVDRDSGVVLQFIEAAVRDDFSGIYALDLRVARIGDAGLYGAQVGKVALDHVDERRRSILLNGGRGNERNSHERIHEQSRVYEFVGEQLVVLVIELRAAFYRACGGVDLIVDGDQMAAGDFVCALRS